MTTCRQAETTGMFPQYPSPMVEYTRPHQRLKLDDIPVAGRMIDLAEGLQGRLYVPAKWKGEKQIDLVIHFHGDSRVAQEAVDQQLVPKALFHCHWGGGSSSYRRPIQEIGAVPFLDKVFQAVQEELPGLETTSVYLTAWSAGYGAVREMIREEVAAGRIDGILLLDGLHCSYVPERKVIAEGSVLDSTQMRPFLTWAKRAAHSKKSLVITHSSVFPGTYASTTETAQYILQRLDIQRQSLLAEGPVGMQQTSIAAKGKLQILSFAGNSAPDHVDHYHGMGTFLRRLE